MDPIATAPAQDAPVTAPVESTPAPSAPAPTSAAESAISKGDVASYREARRAERAGKPLAYDAKTSPDAPTVAPDASAAPPAPDGATQTPERKLSNRQQQINNYERTIAEQNIRLAQLERMVGQGGAARPAEPQAPAATQPTQAEYEQIMAMPGYPKMADFDTLERFNAAATHFTWSVLNQRAQMQAAQQQALHAEQGAHKALITNFMQSIETAQKEDPKFFESLSDEVKAIKPLHAVARGEAATAVNVLGSEVFASPHAAKLLRHFSDHPDVLRSVVQVPAHLAQLPQELMIPRHKAWIARQVGMLEAQLAAPPVAPTPTPATVPAPPQTIGRRPGGAANPMEDAVKRGDMRAFKQLRRQEKLAAMGK